MLLFLGDVQVAEIFQIRLILLGEDARRRNLFDVVVHRHRLRYFAVGMGNKEGDWLGKIVPGGVEVEFRAVGGEPVALVGTQPFGQLVKGRSNLLLALFHYYNTRKNIIRRQSGNQDLFDFHIAFPVEDKSNCPRPHHLPSFFSSSIETQQLPFVGLHLHILIFPQGPQRISQHSFFFHEDVCPFGMIFILFVDFLQHDNNKVVKDSLSTIPAIRQLIKQLHSPQPSVMLINKTFLFQRFILGSRVELSCFYFLFLFILVANRNRILLCHHSRGLLERWSHLSIVDNVLPTVDDFVAFGIFWFFILFQICKGLLIIDHLIIFNIKQEIFLQGLYPQIFLIPRDDSPLLVYLEFEEIHPFDSFELVLYQHLLDQFLALFGNRVCFFWDFELSVLDDVDQLTD